MHISQVCRLQAIREASVHEERHELALTHIAEAERERESLELANMLLKAEYDECLNEIQELLSQKTCCVCMNSLRSGMRRSDFQLSNVQSSSRTQNSCDVVLTGCAPTVQGSHVRSTAGFRTVWTSKSDLLTLNILH